MNLEGIQIKDSELKEMFVHALYFHGHLCPAMPIGLRAGNLARKKLGVNRSQDKELMLLSETSSGHAMACFLDGVMVATGCTYGKGNCKKLNYGKLAFTLIDKKNNKQVRVSVSPNFIINALQNSPFIAERKKGIPPQDVDRELAVAAVNKVLSIPDEDLFIVSEVTENRLKKSSGTFEAHLCKGCKEAVYAKWLRIKNGELYCIKCSGYEE